MSARLPTLLLVVVCAVSCDKAKNLAAKAMTGMKESIAAKGAGSKSATVDAALQKLVDQTPQGAVFRKDLPFPSRLEVTTTRRHEISGRFYQTSAIEKRANLPNGTRILITRFERTDDQIRYTREQSAFQPAADPPSAGKKSAPAAGKKTVPTQINEATVSPATFRKTGNFWRADNPADFRAAALAQELTPVFDQLLIENALASRPLWFAPRRFKVGDPLVVTGDTLPMLLAGDAKGSLTLKLESFGVVEGHPCGVFSLTGDYKRKSFPDFEGHFSDEDVTIQSGKIWLSLVYPIILREELDTIQTLKSGGRGGLVSRGQGSVKVSVTRVWKCLDP